MFVNKKINVLVIESNRFFRESLVALIKREQDLFVDARCFLRDCSSAKMVSPDVALIQCHEATAIQQVVQVWPSTRFVATNVEPQEMNLVSCVQLGILGFVLRDAESNDLLQTIRSVATGDIVLPQIVAKNLCRQLLRNRKNGEVLDFLRIDLTVREKQIFRLIAEGLSNKELAQALNISTHTAKAHVHNILKKLDMHRRINLINYYWQLNTIQANPSDLDRSA
jgi:DNA-binding NarL/FixJ family response regulator